MGYEAWLDVLSVILRMCVQLLLQATIWRLILRGNIRVILSNAALPAPHAVSTVLVTAASLIIVSRNCLCLL